MNREDLLVSMYQCPQEHAEFLRSVGGLNPFGEANWRLIWAANRLEWRGGLIYTWPEYTDAKSRGGILIGDDGSVGLGEVKPTRVEAKLERVPKFPNEAAWILELWFPAHKYGSRADWERNTLDPETGLLRLGPYPEYGDYEAQHTFSSELPSKTQLQQLIQLHDWKLMQKRGSLEQRIKQRIYESEQREEEKKRKEKAEAMARVHEQLSPMFGTSLEAGRIREQWARKAGIRSHVGA